MSGMFVEDDNDSYRAATEGKGVSDDNRTATGTIKVDQRNTILISN